MKIHELVKAVLICGALLLVIVLFAWFFESAQCQAQAERMRVKWFYGPMEGCMITTTKGETVPIKNYRVID